MDPMQLMELRRDRFTQNDQLIYKTIIANPQMVVSKTTSDLAAECGVSQPALSRFVKSLGYARYRDFRSDLVAWLTEQAAGEESADDRRPYFQTLFGTLEAAEKALDDASMRDLAGYVCAHKRVYASGCSKSFQPAMLFEIIMRRNRRGVHAVTSDEINELADYMDEDDLLVLFSVSGCRENIQNAVGINGRLLLVTANPAYDCTGAVDRAVVLPYRGTDAETSSVSPVLFDVFVELLTSYIAMS